MPSRFAVLAATAAVGFALYGASPALAADLPLVGSEACSAAVAADEQVSSAQSTLNTSESFARTSAADLVKAQEAADAAKAARALLEDGDAKIADADALVASTSAAVDKAADTSKTADADVDTAKDALTAAQVDATGRLCSPVETTEPTTTAPAPTTTTTPPVDTAAAAIARVRAAIAAIDCGPVFNARNGAVQDAFRDAQPLLTATQQGALADEYNARLAVLGYCSGSVTATTIPPTTTTSVTVDPTQDDGSVANTSGSQVREVPQGSASTGAA